MNIDARGLREDILSLLREKILSITTTVDGSMFSLASIYRVSMTFKPNVLEPAFTDTILVAQSAGAGACCCIQEMPAIDDGWIGKDVRTLEVGSRCAEIALLDSAYGYFKETPAVTFRLSGSPSVKAHARALLVTSEVLRALRRPFTERRSRVTVVGAVGNIVAELIRHGCEVFATDLDQLVVGSTMSGVEVEDGRLKTLERVMQSDIAIVTGSTLSSNTTGEIIREASEGNTPLVFYAQTGSNFARELIEFGATTVISERFPFYMFPGDSTVDIYRNS